ncbi:hypothetical protein C8J56DRAFT_776282, partial [Mycena floridula]
PVANLCQNFRALNKEAGIPIRQAIEARAQLIAQQKTMKPVRLMRRNPGRMDGQTWNGDSFVCSEAIEEMEGRNPIYHMSDISDDCVSDYEDPVLPETKVVSLMDIARPAKRRGIEKEFEVVQNNRRVIVLEDSEDEADDEREDWDMFADEEEAEKATVKLYSVAVAAGKGKG